MIELLFEFITLADIARLASIPAFGWIAYQDYKTRRVPNWYWLPLLALAVLCVGLDIYHLQSVSSQPLSLYLIRFLLSTVLVGGTGWVAYRLGVFGGADAKGLIILSMLFPTYPSYPTATTVYPMSPPDVNLFALTILTNAVLIQLLYPVSYFLQNVSRRDFSWKMVVGKKVKTANLPETHGRLLEGIDGSFQFGVDLDSLKNYLLWRGLPVSALPSIRDRIESDVVEYNPDRLTAVKHTDSSTGSGSNSESDAWQVTEFVNNADVLTYGATESGLRTGIQLINERETVWISPGMPFFVPLFAGLLVAFTYGDLLYAVVLPLLGVNV